MDLHFPWKGNNIHLNFFKQNIIVPDKNNENIEKNIPEKGPLNFIVGSLTSFLLFIFFYLLSNKIAIYFSIHKPSNSSEIVQNISSSINTLIIGLSFLLTFSFAFIGIGLFIVFIRSFFLKKSWIANIIKKTTFWMSLHDLGLLILLLSPGMILSILLLITFSEGGWIIQSGRIIYVIN